MRCPDPWFVRWPRRLALLLLLVGIVLAVSGLLSGAAHAEPALSPAWRWPVDPAVVLRGFSADQQPYGPGHDGVDLVASPGDPVVSAGAGTVSFVGVVAGRPVVVVQHDGNLRTTYEPVRPGVTRGEPVSTGELLGHLAGQPWHCGWRPCLHWGLRLGSTYLDPLTLLDRGPPRLLPLWSGPTSAAAAAQPRVSTPTAGHLVAGEQPADVRAPTPASPAPPWMVVGGVATGMAAGGGAGLFAVRRWRGGG
jgi:hypothetical protein